MRAKVKEEKWQGKRICNRWKDVHLEQEIALLGLVAGRHPRGTHACGCWYTRALPKATSNKGILS